MIVSKCGISSTGSKRRRYAEFLQTIADAGRELPLVVCRGDFGAVDEPLALWPNIVTVGGVPDWDDADYDVDKAYKRIAGIAALNPKIGYWMYFNEREDVETQMADFYIALLPRLNAVGIGLCMFNSASGRPQYPSIDPVPYRQIARACAFAKMHGYKAIIGLHEYESEYGGATIGRYRVLADYLESRGALLPIAITEWGHETNYNDADYMRFVRSADPIYMVDDRVIGCALWTLGGAGWGGSNYQTMLPQLGQYIATVQPVTFEPPIPEPSTIEQRITALEQRMTVLEAQHDVRA